MIKYKDEDNFNELLKKDPNPGQKNRITKNENNEFIIPGWVIDKSDKMVSVKLTKKFYKTYKLNSQILYDILILGLTDINQRPICPICGNPVNYRNNLLGKNSGYNKTCSINCHYQLVKSKLLSKEAMSKSVATRMKNGSYDHMFGNTFKKDHPPTEEAKKRQSEKMKGRKQTKEAIRKGAEGRSKYYKEHPDKLKNFMNSPKGKNKKGILDIDKSSSKTFQYLSSWEMKLVSFLDSELDDVLQIESPKPIEYEFDGVKHNYYADIDITLSNGKKLLIEIKPSSHLYHKKNQAKFKAGKLFVSANNDYSDYLIITEKLLFEYPRKQKEINKNKIKELILTYLN